MSRKELLLKLGDIVGASPSVRSQIVQGDADLKRILPQVKGVDILFASKFRPNQYWASPKADGVRTAIIVLSDTEAYVLGEGEQSFGKNPTYLKEYPFALDTELLESGEYLVFDGYGKMFSGTYGEKTRKIREVVKSPLRMKRIVIATQLKNLMREDPGYGVDGVVFTDNLTSSAYKWKPKSQLTIDFLLKDNKLHVKDDGAVVFEPKFLSKDDPQKFGFSVKEPAIVECCYSDEWKLVRVREDREHEVKTGTYFGNHRFVADKIWFEIHYPVPLDWLQYGRSPYERKGHFNKSATLSFPECAVVVSGAYLFNTTNAKTLFVLAPDPYEVASLLGRSKNLCAVALAGSSESARLFSLARERNAKLVVFEPTADQKRDLDKEDAFNTLEVFSKA